MKLHNLTKRFQNSEFTSFHRIVGAAHHSHNSKDVLNPEEYLIINLMLDGEGLYKTKDKEYIVKPNQITITNPSESHELYLSTDYNQCTLIYTPAYISNFLMGLTQSHSYLLENIINPKKQAIDFTTKLLTEKWDTVAIVKKIFEIVTSDLDKEHLVLLGDLYFQEALIAIVRNEYIQQYQNQINTEPSAPVKHELKHRIQKAVTYISDNYQQDISLDQLAQISGMSKYHFTRTFKQIMNANPHEYLAQRRIENAKMYLRNSYLSPSEIALEVGFANPNSFYRFFKRMVGLTPNQFRKQ